MTIIQLRRLEFGELHYWNLIPSSYRVNKYITPLGNLEETLRLKEQSPSLLDEFERAELFPEKTGQ